VTYALTEGPNGGWAEPATAVLGLTGLLALAAFVVVELRSRDPMVPPDIFRSPLFTAANLVTLVVYAALGAALFLIPIQLQQVAGYSPLQSGAALIPLTLFMLVLSARAGRLAQRIGPRLPMTAGPIVAGAGLALLVRAGPGSDYVTDVLPGILVFGLGLAFTVAPLTATVLGAAPDEQAGVASAINTDVSRIAGLLAVAVVPVAAGISGADYLDPSAFNEGFRIAIVICAALCAAGGLLAFATIRRPRVAPPGLEPFPHCGITGPPPAETVAIEARA
jgi:MFS family permease